MEQLSLAEKKAIELHYLGKTYKDIGQEIETPEETVINWFRPNGRLLAEYNKFAIEMDEKRKKEFEKRIFLSDEQWGTLASNTASVYAEQSLNPNRKVPLRNKFTNEIIHDKKTGEPILIDYRPKITPRDLKAMWEMERVMQGLPTKYEKQEVQQFSVNAQVIIKELHLTAEDFKDENREQTGARIRAYLRGK